MKIWVWDILLSCLSPFVFFFSFTSRQENLFFKFGFNNCRVRLINKTIISFLIKVYATKIQ